MPNRHTDALRAAADLLDTMPDDVARGAYVTCTKYVTDNVRVDLHWFHLERSNAEQSALAGWLIKNVDAEWTRSQRLTEVIFEATLGDLCLFVAVDAARDEQAVA